MSRLLLGCGGLGDWLHLGLEAAGSASLHSRFSTPGAVAKGGAQSGWEAALRPRAGPGRIRGLGGCHLHAQPRGTGRALLPFGSGQRLRTPVSTPQTGCLDTTQMTPIWPEGEEPTHHDARLCYPFKLTVLAALLGLLWLLSLPSGSWGAPAHPAVSLAASHGTGRLPPPCDGGRGEQAALLPLARVSPLSAFTPAPGHTTRHTLTPICRSTKVNAQNASLFPARCPGPGWRGVPGRPGHSCTRKLMRAVLGDRKAFLMLRPCRSRAPSSL